MAERTSITQTVQLAKETTPGTAVAANKRLRSVSIDLSPEGGIRVFRPTGSKLPAVAALGKEWLSGPLSGAPTYDEIIHPLAMAFGPPTITTPGGGTTSRSHAFPIEPSAAQDPATYTVEQGSSVRAHRSAYVHAPEVGIAYNRDEITLSGQVMGRRLEDNFTLTASPTAFPLIPVLPTQVSVYFDTTFGALGTTKLLRVMSADWSVGNRFAGLWPLDAAQASFAATYEVEPSTSVTLLQEADAVGMSHLPRMRNGDIGYLRIEAVGPIIEAAITYKLTQDFPVRVTEIPSFSDADGIYGVEWGFQLFDDGTNKPSITVVNTQTAL